MSSPSPNLHFWFNEFIDEISAYQRELTEDWFDRLATFDAERDLVDIGADCAASLAEGLVERPTQWVERSLQLWQRQSQLLADTALGWLGAKSPEPEPAADARFHDPAWRENPTFDLLRREYQLWSQQVLAAVDELHDSDARRHQRLVYFVRQWVSALAPSNFPLTNPEVLRSTFSSGGRNIVEGMRMLLEDHKRSGALLNVCMSAPDALQLGRDVATTPGEVVYENHLMQLIQYRPLTDTVARTPILVVPSWVNKFYILDLKPENSFVRWLLEQGHTVFMISWVNPDGSHGDQRFDDYLNHGVLQATVEIARQTGERRVTGVGYCLGGILLASALAWCAAAGDDRFISATYLAASVDFSNPGDMGMFVDEQSVDALERRMAGPGYLDGRLLAAGFSLLRENELFWSYYVTNYLHGQRPRAHDLMHWNSDNTNVTAASHSFVLRELHLYNRLMQPDAINLHGHPIDMRRIATPTYVLATEKDHIARWHSTYTATQLQSGPCRFVLAGSGHIAGVINPPARGKYGYYINDVLPPDADTWKEGAVHANGSWWPDWQRWQAQFAGDRVPARAPDADSVIEPAPGRYVYRRLDS